MAARRRWTGQLGGKQSWWSLKKGRSLWNLLLGKVTRGGLRGTTILSALRDISGWYFSSETGSRELMAEALTVFSHETLRWLVANILVVSTHFLAARNERRWQVSRCARNTCRDVRKHFKILQALNRFVTCTLPLLGLWCFKIVTTFPSPEVCLIWI